MRFFICLLDPERRGISAALQRAYESLPRSRELTFRWQSVGDVPVLLCDDGDDGEPLIASENHSLASGMVRLDNRAELERQLGRGSERLTDLELVLRLVLRRGTRCIPHIQGDFAFVVWNAATRAIIAVCDPFAVRKLYYARRDGLIVFASRAEALALHERYEVQYLAELAANCTPSRELTAYLGVKSVPAASFFELEQGRLTIREYWSPENFEPNPSWATLEHDAATTCRALLIDAVRLRLGGHGATWAQLSGGIDSSAIASIAQWLVESGALTHGLAGTVSYVDRQGTGADEREYSDAVTARWRVRNEKIIDPPFWYDESYPLPHTDLPTFSLPFYPREQRLCAIVRNAGGRILLTGIGGDEFFTGIMLFFADWAAQGRVWAALREMVRRAAMGRVSFWELAYRNAVLPLMPQPLQLLLEHDQTQLPRWINPAIAKRYRLRQRAFVSASYAGRRGNKYHHAIVTNVLGISTITEYGTIPDSLDVRHPFLYRPLVEFALQLPPELCARPYERKWILRQALHGILPEFVRTRVGKGTPFGLYVHSMTAQRSLLEPLVHQPMLADLGIIDGAKLSRAFKEVPHAPQRKGETHAALHRALMIEAWLEMRSGRWPRGSRRTRNVQVKAQVHHPSTEGNLRRSI